MLRAVDYKRWWFVGKDLSFPAEVLVDCPLVLRIVQPYPLCQSLPRTLEPWDCWGSANKRPGM